MYTCFIFSGSKIEACRCGFSLENQVRLDICSYQIIRVNSTGTSVSKICVHRNICINNIRESQRLRFASVARVRGPPSKARIRVVFMRYGHRAGGAASPGALWAHSASADPRTGMKPEAPSASSVGSGRPSTGCGAGPGSRSSPA